MRKVFRLLAIVIALCMIFEQVALAAVDPVPLSTGTNASVFSDIKTHWCKEIIEKFAQKGWVEGYEDGSFKPDKLVGRAEFTAMVVRILKKLDDKQQCSFKDVKQNDWFYGIVASASKEKYIEGYQDGTFRPLQSMSRQEVAVFVKRLLSVVKLDSGKSINFKDENEIASWAAESITALTSNNVINGYPDGNFKPLRFTTRAEAVKMLDVTLRIIEEGVPASGNVNKPETPDKENTTGSAITTGSAVTTKSAITPNSGGGGGSGSGSSGNTSTVNTNLRADAGQDQNLILPKKSQVNGKVTYFGGNLTGAAITWSKVSGPDIVKFEDSTKLSTTAEFSVSGIYVLRLLASYSGYTAFDDVTVNVDAIHKTYTATKDFNEGSNVNISESVPDQLQIDGTSQVANYIWVAVSSKGTVVKINTDTGKIEGEYYTSPNGQPKNPSRTTVDLNGNVWCTNRDGNSVIQIGLLENGQWIDKNGNGKCDTSTGLGDVKPWTNNGGADTNGGVSTAEDECIIKYVKVSASGTRHVSVTKDNDIWVSGKGPAGNGVFDLIDGVTGKIKRTEGPVGVGGYGGLIDKNGIIWSSNPLLWWDTSKPLSGASGQNWKNLSGYPSYGLAIDKYGNVWCSSYGSDSKIRKFSPSGDLLGTYNQGNYYAQGCVGDSNGDIWVAHSLNSGTNTVGHLKNDGTYVGTVTVGNGPTGVAVDAKGKIWVTNYNSKNVMRIDPNAGPIGSDGVTHIGAVDYTSVDLGGNPYDYSDMTGSTLTGAPKEGTWTTVYDSGVDNLEWGKINWHGKRINDSTLVVSVSSSADGKEYSTPSAVRIGQQMNVPNGRYLKVNAKFKRSQDGETPVLEDLTVGAKGYYTGEQKNEVPKVEAGDNISVRPDEKASLKGIVSDDFLVDESLKIKWTKVSGPGEVVFDSDTACSTKASFTKTGEYILRLTANDGELEYSDDVKVTVNLNSNPVITFTPVTKGKEGAVYEYAVKAEDADKDTLIYSLTKAPTGMAIDSKTGLITWTPSGTQSGKYDVTVKAEDGKGGSVSQEFSIEVEEALNNKPQITSTAVTTAKEGALYTYIVKATDADNDTLTYSLVTSPAGMTVNGKTGVISWTPSHEQAGKNSVTVKVSDGHAGEATQNFTIDVEALNNNPQITSIAVITAKEGVAYTYDVKAADADNDILTYSLVASPTGMTINEKTGVISWAPSHEQAGKNSVTVKVSDGHGGEATQSYTIDVEAVAVNSQPQITSIAITTAKEGVLYSYDIEATDADNDILTYSLVTSPAGMTINEKTGVISWTPSHEQAGKNSVTVKVSDGRGGEATQSFTIDIEAVAVNLQPQITSTAVTTAKEGAAYIYEVKAIDADNDILTYTLTTSPVGMSINEKTGEISWTPSKPQTGSNNIEVRVSDGKGGIATQAFSVNVEESTTAVTKDTIRPAITLKADRDVVKAGETVNLTVSASDDTGVASKTLLVNGKTVKLDASGKGVFTSTETGIFKAVAKATDNAGNEGAAEGEITFITSGDKVSPTAEITSPANDTKLLLPTEIIGTVKDDVKLISYKLEYSEKDKNQFIAFASGVAPVINGVLGKLDPTLMRNGLYDIRLTAIDASGNISSYSTAYQLDGEAKVGNFSIAFEDMTIPVSGIPITITRSYDSRNKIKGDFGIGWTLGIQDIKVSESGPLGKDWEQTKTGGLVPTYYIRGTEPHYVTITYPDGKTEEFNMVVIPSSQRAYPIEYPTVAFEARPGTLSKLESLDSNDCYAGGGLGNVELMSTDDLELYNPNRYKLTAQDGTVLILNQQSGLESIESPDGSKITFSKNGIIHSSGKSVTFTRDAQGRITSITDPMGNAVKYEYDFYGDLIKVTDREGNATGFTYNFSHGLVDIIDPRGIKPARNEYDDNGRLKAHIDANGNRIEYEHNDSARQEAIKDRMGNSTVIAYDEKGNVLSKTDALGNTTSYTYDERGNMLSQKDALGNVTTSTYDANNNILSQTDAAGNKSEFTYDSSGRVLSSKDAMGNVTESKYNANGTIASTKGPDGKVTSYSYDAKGNTTQVTDPYGKVTKYTYDSNGNTLSQTDSDGNVTSFTYDANGNQITKTITVNGESYKTTYVYDKVGRVIETIDPNGDKTKTEYNEIGKVSASVDKSGNRIEYEYDAPGNKTRVKYPDGSEEKYTYDSEGRKLTSTDRSGRTISYTYDKLGRTIKTTFLDGTTIQNEYDSVGHIISKIDARGNKTQYKYDAIGNQTSVIDALGNETKYEYDKAGRQIKVTDAIGNSIQFEYDAAGHKIKTIFADGTFTTTTYDEKGIKTSDTDQAGKTTKYECNAAGKLSKVIDALSNTTEYAYDANGSVISQKDANGHVTSFEYDKFGRRTKRALPLGMAETASYNSDGNIASVTDFNGNSTSYKYNKDGQLEGKIYPDGKTEVYAYTNTGLKQSVTDSNGKTSYEYDLRDRIKSQTNPDGSTISYTYDAAGNRTSIITASGTTTYSYDALNRLEKVTDPDGGVTAYTYDAVGNRQSVTYPNNTISEYTYDSLNRLTKLVNKKADGAIISSYEYTLGPSGNRLKVVENTGRTVNYTYDDTYKLTREDINTPGAGVKTIIYTYDAVGNRLTKSDNGILTSYKYDENNRLLSDGTNTYTYDNNGNTLTKTGTAESVSYTYDYNNKLIKAVTTTASGTSTTEYVYNVNGTRVQKIVDGKRISYLVDENTDFSNVIEEVDETGKIIVSYVYGDDLISQKRDSNTSYYHYDGIGSTRVLTSKTGDITDTYNYDAFGVLLDKTGTTVNNYLYTGEQYDANLGFYYLRARYMDPSTGRFVTMDSYEGQIYDPVSLHKYLYANASPSNFIDPSGNFSLGEMVAVMTITTILCNIVTTGLAFNSMAKSGFKVDGFIVSLRGSYSFKYLTVGGGIDMIIDFKTREPWFAFEGEGGLNPVALFGKHRGWGGFSVMAGMVFGMSDPNDFSGWGISAAWPMAVLHLMPIINFGHKSTWGAMTQFAKKAKNGLGWTTGFGWSTSGSSLIAFGKGSSFSWVTTYDSPFVPFSKLASSAQSALRPAADYMENLISKWSSDFDGICDRADQFLYDILIGQYLPIN